MERKRQFLLFLACLILAGYLIVRLVDQTAIVTRFPLDNINDISSYWGIFHFFDKYGYYGFAPEWYNGFTVLKFYSPSWWFFVYPLFLLLGNVQTATYASILLILVLGYIAFYFLGRALKLTRIETAFFFLLFFANPVNIAEFYRLGRAPTMFSWLVFAALVALIYTYKEKKIDGYFVSIYTILLSAMILSHPGVTILAGFFILSLFLVKSWKEKMILFLSSLLSLIFTSFWWVGFVSNLSRSTVQNFVMHSFLLQKEWLGNLFILCLMVLTFLVFLFLRIKTTSKKEILFYLPHLALIFLLATQLLRYIPGINQINSNFYITFFLCFTTILYFQINFMALKIKRSILDFAIFLFSLLFVMASHIVTPYYADFDSLLQKSAFDALDHLDAKYAFLGTSSPEVYPKAIYSYAAIYRGLSTISGWSTHELTPEHLAYLRAVGDAFEGSQCKKLSDLLVKSNVGEAILYGENCNKMSSCGFPLKYSNDHFCIYRIL